MKKTTEILAKAILAGLMIGLAGSVYLSIKGDSKIVGSLLFSFGLLTIVSLDYKLYTGRVAYIVDNKPSYLLDVLLIIIGNLIGTFIIASFIMLGNQTVIITEARALIDIKLSKTLIEAFGLSVLCGVMMYLGVEGFKRFENKFAKVLAIIFAVMIFILAGFEHSVANMFYYAFAESFNFNLVISILVMILGNGVGAILFNLLEKYAKTK